MSTQTITRKRKSVDGSTTAPKKAKVSKSADKPAPLKSALKKSAKETAVKKAVPTLSTKKRGSATTSTKQKAAITKPVLEDGDDNEDEEGGAPLTSDQTAALLAGFSSSDEDEEGPDGEGIPVSKLPQAPRTDEIQRQLEENNPTDSQRTSGVIYISRLPHGFFEHQLKSYFSQFGSILHLRLARNRKTGKSKHYAFVEFASGAVADIVTKTMDKYLLFGHLLQVKRVPNEQVKPEKMWGRGGKASGLRVKKPMPRNRLEGAKFKRGMVREEWDGKVQRESQRRKEKAEKLAEIGYEFEMPTLKGVDEVPKKVKEVEDVVAGDAVATDDQEAKTEDVDVVRTVQTEPNGVKITEVKTSKKRTAPGKVKGGTKKLKA